MKKIIFLMIITFAFSSLINAYEYLIYSSNTLNPSLNKESWLINENGYFYLRVKGDNSTQYLVSYPYTAFYEMKSGVNGYINNNDFMEFYKNDSVLLNDLYTSTANNRNVFLNYLYNSSPFSNLNYINYENYELLYNSDGLVVESIVNGNWAGLYDGPDHSGYLYDEKGDLKYINGVSPSFFESIFNKLMRRFGINLQSIFIKKIFYPLLILIFVCVVFRTVIRLAFKAFLIRFYDKKIGQLEKRREKIENA